MDKNILFIDRVFAHDVWNLYTFNRLFISLVYYITLIIFFQYYKALSYTFQSVYLRDCELTQIRVVITIITPTKTTIRTTVLPVIPTMTMAVLRSDLELAALETVVRGSGVELMALELVERVSGVEVIVLEPVVRWSDIELMVLEL